MGNPWTLGPWHRSSTHYGKAVDIGAADGDNIALIYGPAENGSDNFKANARLIQHAPEMAEALECLARMAEHFPAERIYGTRPRSGAIYTVADVEHGEASLTVEDLHRARTLLSRIRGDAT
jgi:hypothetical protein